jgi:hypothetical protein
VTSQSLARSYLVKAKVRLKALAVLRDEGGFSDVVREAQELVELALKGMLRAAGVEPPKFHDVGGLLLEHRAKFPADVAARLARAASISKRLRRERELAFYGDIDFVPTEEYSAADAARAFEDAAWIVALAEDVIALPPSA